MTSGKPTASFRLRLGQLLWLMAWLGYSHGNLLAEPLSLDQLLKNFAAISSSQAHFTETQTLAILESPLISSGHLIYRRPDYLKKTVTEPTQALFEINGDRLLVETDQGRHSLSLNNQPTIRAFAEAYRATLAGDRAVLEQFYRLALTGNTEAWALRLVPLDKRMRSQVRFIEMQGTAARILRIETQEASGDHSLMTVVPDAVADDH